MNKKIIIALIMVLVAVCGVSTYFHIKGRIESEENQKMYERGCRINSPKKKNRVARKGCPVSAFYSII